MVLYEFYMMQSILFLQIVLKCQCELSGVNQTLKILSRRKRYLQFPEGSSLQLAFCLTMPSIGVGDIFTVGSTAALAWELPHNPFAPFRRHSEVLHRIDDKLEEFTPSMWNSQTSNATYDFKNNLEYNNHYRNDQKNHPYGHKSNTYHILQPAYHEIHRRTRRDLYMRIEKMLSTLKHDGKACILKIICDVSKITQKPDSFAEVIISTIFRVRRQNDENEIDEYDQAMQTRKNCTEAYPSCNTSIFKTLIEINNVAT